jgi:opacity protein-like surface antigen
MRFKTFTTATLLASIAGFAPAAFAADFSLGPLRGTHYGAPMGQTHIWEGGYFGAFAGTSHSSTTFKGTLTKTVADLLRNRAIEDEMGISRWLDPGSAEARKASFGFFAGVNYQYDEAVLGFEADFTRTRLRTSGSDQMARMRVVDPVIYNADARGSVTAEIKEVATLRARAGYTMGSFMPFVTGGIALANYTVTREATVSTREQRLDIGTDISTVSVAPRRTQNRIGFGLTGGLGVDMAVSENLFLRGEWQYIHFRDLDGVRANLNTFRAGAAVKF